MQRFLRAHRSLDLPGILWINSIGVEQFYTATAFGGVLASRRAARSFIHTLIAEVESPIPLGTRAVHL